MTPTAVHTILTIFRPGREPERQVIGMSEQPGLGELKSVVCIDGEKFPARPGMDGRG